MMTLIPWKAKRQDEQAGLPSFSGFRSEMDRLFDSFLRDSFNWGDRGGAMNLWGPPVDVEETDKELVVRAEIPGMKPEELQLSIDGNSLVVAGEKKESEEKHERNYTYQERRFGSFRREVPLPTAVNADTVQAEYKDGVLQVKLEKAQEALPKKIEVKAT